MRNKIKKAACDKRFFRRHPGYAVKWRKKNKSRMKFLNHRWRVNHFEQKMLLNAVRRAKKRRVPCTITIADIQIPRFCPVLGIELCRNTGTFQDNSPSLDCVISQLGYVPGNVAVISMRANRIKNNASLDEIKKVVKWLSKWEQKDARRSS